MTRQPILATCVTATVAIACMTVGEASAKVTVAGPRQGPASKWEYCCVFGADGGNVMWSKGDGELVVDSWKALAQKMHVRLKEKAPSDRSIRMAIFNHLGAQGWELVSHSALVERGTYIEICMFKRQVR